MTESKQFVDVFIWLRDVYRNCFRVLNCCDPILEEYGILRYPDTWNHVYNYDPIKNETTIHQASKVHSLGDADALLHLSSYIFRQYHTRELEDKEIITVGLAPWRKAKPEAFNPVCYMTRFLALSTEGEEVYWIGAMPIWEEDNISDGKIREFNSGSGLLADEKRKTFDEIVSKEKTMIGAAIPLFDINSSRELEDKLIRPFLAYHW